MAKQYQRKHILGGVMSAVWRGNGVNGGEKPAQLWRQPVQWLAIEKLAACLSSAMAAYRGAGQPCRQSASSYSGRKASYGQRNGGNTGAAAKA